VHMISKIAHVHLLSNPAFMGAVNAPQVRVTKVAHQHIKMTGKTWGLAALGPIVLQYITIITHMPANRPRRYAGLNSVCYYSTMRQLLYIYVCASARAHVCLCAAGAHVSVCVHA
jgi:hypothetical protein